MNVAVMVNLFSSQMFAWRATASLRAKSPSQHSTRLSVIVLGRDSARKGGDITLGFLLSRKFSVTCKMPSYCSINQKQHWPIIVQ